MGTTNLNYSVQGDVRKVTFTTEDGFIPKDAVCLGCVMMLEEDGTRRKIKIAIESGEFLIDRPNTNAFEKWVRQACRDKSLQEDVFNEPLKNADPRRFNPSWLYSQLGWGHVSN